MPAHDGPSELPPIPGKRYFTIGEVSQLCDVEQHVLRHWENEFAQLAPSRRGGNRRYYQHGDVLVVRQIRALRYEQGLTTEGVRRVLAGEGSKQDRARSKQLLRQTITELEEVLRVLRGAPHRAGTGPPSA